MNAPKAPPAERRRHRRIAADNVRVRLVSGEYDDLTSGVNFARRLLNVSLGGMCIETTGRLRAGVTMSAELRFDAFGGSLRTKAQLIWVETVKEGAAETHLAGLRFIGPELTATVREYLEGARASMIATKKREEYEVLKKQSEARKTPMTRDGWSTPKKIGVAGLVIALLYVGGFAGAVLAGRRDAPGPGIHFRYPGGSLEQTLTTVFSPLYWAARKAGIDLTVDAP